VTVEAPLAARFPGMGRVPVGRAGAPDRGSATVLVLAVGLLTVLVALAFAAVGSAIVARHRAQTAADLGALAGAARALDGTDAACARAAEIVGRNRAVLTACELDGLDVIVTAEATPAGLAAVFGTAHASARAGPVEPDEAGETGETGETGELDGADEAGELDVAGEPD
jgi:secretion/DNA translocation related TadE-like protein